MEAAFALIAVSRFAPSGTDVVALDNPAIQSVLQVVVDDQIVVIDPGYVDIVYQAFPLAQQEHV